MVDESLRQIDLDLVKTVSRLEEKMDAITRKLDAIEKLERRISALEKARTYSSGWFAGAVAVASVIGGVLTEIFRRCFGM